MTNDKPITPDELRGFCILCNEPLVPRNWTPETAIHFVRRITLTDKSGKILRRFPDDPGEHIVHGHCADRAERSSEG